MGELVKELQPTPGLMVLARTMFRDAWDLRSAQARHIQQRAQRQLGEIDKQMDPLLARIIDTSNLGVIQTYEDKTAELESSKARLMDQAATQTQPSKSFGEKLEHLLTFLANLWKL